MTTPPAPTLVTIDQLLPSESAFDALIFDCDGTLADTMPAHYLAWLAALKPHGVGFDEDRFYAMGGWPTWKVAETLFAEVGQSHDLDSFVIRKEAAFEDFLPQIQAIDPVVNLARRYHGRLPLAVATGGLRSVCTRILETIEVLPLFETMVTCEDVADHKPHPEVYLEAARRLKTPAARCLAFEDTDPGVQSATRAGMHCIDVRRFYRPQRVSPPSA